MRALRIPRLSSLAAIALLALVPTLFASAAETDISDVPMAVKNNVPPNFMYMVDNSGSMNNILPEAPYSASTTYWTCPSDKVATGGFSNPAVPSNTSYDLWFENSKARFSADGGRTNYTFGTDENQRCFEPNSYYRFRLYADSHCGRGCKAPGNYGGTVYSGNYLNWYFGNGTFSSSEGRKSGTRTRLEIAKLSAKATLDNLPLKTGSGKAKARVGLAAYKNDDNVGGGELFKNVADLDSTHLSNLKSSIDGLSANSNTPLSETLADIGHYFSLPYEGNLTLHPETSRTVASVASVFKQGSTSPHKLDGTLTAPIQNWCQRSYAVLLTDGRPSQDRGLATNEYLCDYDGDSGGCKTDGATAYDQKTGNAASNHAGHSNTGVHSYESGGSDYLDDVAQALYEIDLRPDLQAPEGRTKKNNVRTYTISFADATASNDPLLRETATQGGGTFHLAGDETELLGAFSDAMNDAFAKDSASASVAVVNTQLTVDNTAYTSSFNSGFWTGDLRAFTLDTTTARPSETPIWSAQNKLDKRSKPATNRNIVTYDGSKGVAFRGTKVTLAASNNTNLINYLRGDNSKADGVLFRKRKSLLGDIINAEPVVVKYGDTPVIFQAANDGMLHVFNGCGSLTSPCKTGAGEELWAYVPKMVWSSLTHTNAGFADPNYAHKYFIDATPVVGEITRNGVKERLLVGGLGKGGKGYYALDVTEYSASNEDAYAKKVRWEFPASATSVAGSVGYSFGTPLIVNSPRGWVVLVTSGYNNSDGSGKVFVLDPENGSVLHTISTDAGSVSSPAGLVHLARPGHAASSEVVKYVYGGDLLGNVWRFDLTNWKATKIAVLKDGSGTTQPVTTAPAIGPVTGSTSKYFVYVGTGQYLGDSDIPGNIPENSFAKQTQSMYGIIDDTSVASPSLPDIRGSNGSTCPDDGGNGDFLCQNQGTAVNGDYTGTPHNLEADHRGWYLDFPIAYARLVTHPQLSEGGALVFTINLPTNVTCDPGGQSWFANFDAGNGGAVPKTLGGQEYWPSITPLAYSLASRPVIVYVRNIRGDRLPYGVIRTSGSNNGSGSGENGIGGGGTEALPIRERPKPSPAAVPWKRVYWRELM